MIRNLIREELQTVLREQSTNWWHNPSDMSNPHSNPDGVHEARVRKPRPSVGKKISKRGGARFTSAGTIPYEKGRELNPAKVANREAIGIKMLNVHRRGGPIGRAYRQKIKAQLDSKGLPLDKKHQYSQIWANASGMAAKGADAADFTPLGKKKSKKKKAAKKKAATKQPNTQAPQTPPAP